MSKDNAAKLGRDLDHLSDSELKPDQSDYLSRRDEVVPLLTELAEIPLPTNPKSSEVKAVKDKLKEIVSYVQKGGTKPSLEATPTEAPAEAPTSQKTSPSPTLVPAPGPIPTQAKAKTITLGKPESTAQELLNHYKPDEVAKLVSCLESALSQTLNAA